MSETSTTPKVKVSAVIKKSQRRGNKGWFITFRGEEKEIMTDVIQFSAESLEEALDAIKLDELRRIDFSAILE